ncbi:hypothetical protein K438DRAFT_1606987, partial [Mycena galopus ATCC 62051]
STCAQPYTVVSGDTCSIIELKTGLNDTQLHALNPGINNDCTSKFPYTFPDSCNLSDS